jgi:hypothetical protein
MRIDLITEHEAQQRAAVNAALYSTYGHCTGPCEQGDRVCMTPEACQLPSVADAAEGWEPASVADNLAFWLPVLFCTGLFVLALVFFVGWRP